MLVNKVTVGFVVQVFDTEKKRFVSQAFVAGDQCDYEDKDGERVDRKALEVDGKEVLLPFDMVQPKDVANVPQTPRENMEKTRLKVVVPVSFTGTVEVEVPADVPPERREALARKVALARVLTTTENPDAPEDEACAEYEEEFGLGDTPRQRTAQGGQGARQPPTGKGAAPCSHAGLGSSCPCGACRARTTCGPRPSAARRPFPSQFRRTRETALTRLGPCLRAMNCRLRLDRLGWWRTKPRLATISDVGNHRPHRRLAGSHAGRRRHRPHEARRTLLRTPAGAGEEDASALPQSPSVGADRRRVRGGGHPAPPCPGDRPARVAEALLQLGGNPDPPCAHRLGSPLLRPRGLGQSSRHGCREDGRQRRRDTSRRTCRASPATLPSGASSTSRLRRCPRRNRKCSTCFGTSN